MSLSDHNLPTSVASIELLFLIFSFRLFKVSSFSKTGEDSPLLFSSFIDFVTFLSRPFGWPYSLPRLDRRMEPVPRFPTKKVLFR